MPPIAPLVLPAKNAEKGMCGGRSRRRTSGLTRGVGSLLLAIGCCAGRRPCWASPWDDPNIHCMAAHTPETACMFWLLSCLGCKGCRSQVGGLCQCVGWVGREGEVSEGGKTATNRFTVPAERPQNEVYLSWQRVSVRVGEVWRM